MFTALFKNFKTQKKMEQNVVSYRRGPYQKWSIDELGLVDEQIIKDHENGSKINLTPLLKQMPYRTEPGIRSRVRMSCAELGVEYGTYTEKENK